MKIEPEKIASRLVEIVGATHVSSAPADVDTYGGIQPILVVWPGAPSEVASVLRGCSEAGVAVCVAGYGTRATRHWPLPDDRPRVALDTRRMTNILDVDELALTVNSQCGIQLRHLEEALGRQGLTIGPYPREIHFSTLGGLLAAPSPIAHSPRTGWFSDACLGISVAHADGSLIQTRVAPRKATGPDLSRLYIGSRGGLGVITTATLRVHRLPEQSLPLAFGFPDLATAAVGARRCLERGARPICLRVLDAPSALEELSEMASMAGAVLLAVLAGPAALVAEEHRLFDDHLGEAGANELPHALAVRWWERRCGAREEGTGGRPRPLGARLRHSRLADALVAVPRIIRKRAISLSLDQFTLQGVTLWLQGKDIDEGASTLRTALLNAGLDPLGSSFPPLMEELRAKLDPHETLVVMEV